MSAPERSELEMVEDDLIKLLKDRLASGKIRSMESKLLLEILARRDAERPKTGEPLPGLKEDLPFENEDMVVS